MGLQSWTMNFFHVYVRLQLFLFDNGVTTLARNNWLRVHHWPQALKNKHFSYTLASLYTVQYYLIVSQYADHLYLSDLN